MVLFYIQSILNVEIGEKILEQKERLERIKKKHAKQRYKLKILRHRLMIGVCAVILILLVIVVIKSCVSYTSKLHEEERLQTTEIPQATQTPIVQSDEIVAEYYANSAFVGNSFIEGLALYSFFEDVDYFAKIGLNVNDALTKPTSTGTVPVIEELNNGKQYNKIFMMFGENELGWQNKDIFISQYGVLIDKAKEYQPESKLYLLGVTPVTKEVSDANENNTNNDSIKEINEMIKQLALDKGAVYADLYDVVAGEDGTLPADAASDGIHFGEEYYKKCLVYIQNNL